MQSITALCFTYRFRDRCISFGILFASCFFASEQIFAADDYSLPSRLSVNFGADNDGSRDQSLNLLINRLPSDASVSAGIVSTQNSIDVGRTDFETDTIELGIASSPYYAFEIGFDYSKWDSRDEFTITTNAPWIRFNQPDWSVSTTFYRRDIGVRLINDEVVGVESDGYAIAWDWYGYSSVWFGASATTHSYSRDVSRINNLLVFLRLSPAARVFAFGLEESAYSMRAGGVVSNAIVDLDWRRGTSAVDASESSIFSASIEYPLDERISVNALWGSQRTDNSDGVQFYGLGLSIDW